MNTEPKRYQLDRMVKLAQQFVDELVRGQVVERVAVAGSVRRQAPWCKDIEICCVPLITKQQVTLDGTTEVERTAVDDWCDFRLQRGTLQHRLDKNGRKSCGMRFKRLLWFPLPPSLPPHPGNGPGPIPIDLFIVIPPASWGVVYAVRTGPAEFSHWLATRALQQGMKLNDGHLERADGTLISTPEETDFLRELGIEFKEPWHRAPPPGFGGRR